MFLRTRKTFNALFENLPTSEKILHLTVVIWVSLQIISSYFMHVHSTTLWADINLMSQFHVYSGLLLFVITSIFFMKILNRRKAKDIYPWLYKDFDGIKQDSKTLMAFRLPTSRPGGLAATVEGLGCIALMIALLTGIVWYVTVGNGVLSPVLLKTHKVSVGLIEAYFYGHAFFGFLHLFQRLRSKE
ncbi:hypothetical protein E2R68_04020 [Psychromonas sp. RZ22]|uniref:cytochrome b/b6 domain-containing protein n=1 Tax=Psychromonas algarum TaxID=2555643 RepID=UPI001067A1C8|nr:cytochrome b/b6 domain-containing protein [Psychromonas sp. RZ22]TEW55562.1 hypothetical protein E2R68_04020 [Psychromonas sp. RZ22]